ncbi:MAG: LuxR family transcriptional regulator [Pseudomonadota bacterium]
MKTWMETFLDRLQSASTLEDIQRLIPSLRDHLGVAHAIYHHVGTTGREFGALTYAPDWVGHYVDQQYFKTDPVVLEGLQRTGPLNWSRLDWSAAAPRQLLSEATESGVGDQGYSIPLRGVGGRMALFSVTSFDQQAAWDRFGDENLRELVLAAHFVHQKVGEIMEAVQAPPPALTPRERDVLTLLSLGRSRAEAAENLAISEHTLRSYLDTAREKLGATNTTHAVATAMTRGLIIP